MWTLIAVYPWVRLARATCCSRAREGEGATYQVRTPAGGLLEIEACPRCWSWFAHDKTSLTTTREE